MCTAQITISYIAEGIKKLRGVGAREGGLVKKDLWRGMGSLSMSAPLEKKFQEEGGSVSASLAPDPTPCRLVCNQALHRTGAGANEHYSRSRHGCEVLSQ